MTRLVQQVKVKTNATPGSICQVDMPAVKFSDLWGNYVTGNPYEDSSGQYTNQCAIRMSATFHKIGIAMRSFSEKSIKPMAGKKTIGRILLDGKPTATRAQELGEWLKLVPFCGLPPKPENITGKDWEAKVKGRTGIIMFDGYWARVVETAASGGHIDLWNGSRLTNNGAIGALETFSRFTLGINNPWVPFYSDLRNAKVILFFSVK